MAKEYRGLKDSEILLSRQKYGKNEITEIKSKSFFKKFFENLGDPVIRVLLIALFLNVAFNFRNINYIENGGIALAIFMATLISTISEYSSQKAFQKMKLIDVDLVKVRRNGIEKEILSTELVVGDVLLLFSGEKVEADGILIDGELLVDQSALTGESIEIEKNAINLKPSDFYQSESGFSFVCPIDDHSPSNPHSVFKGSLIGSKNGEMIITSVGEKTKLGKIYTEIQSEKRGSPLKEKLGILSKEISIFGYIAGGIIALISFFTSISLGFTRSEIIANLKDISIVFPTVFKSITLGLTVILMAVPEGLPMMVAVILSSNIKKMLKSNVLVRKPVGIESAGSMNLLFTDKTGTLTKGKISLDKIILGNGKEIKNAKKLKESSDFLYTDFKNQCLYNTSSIFAENKTVGGNTTERALLSLFQNEKQSLIDKRTNICPFDSKTKYSSATVLGKTYIKGASEIVLSKCSSYIDESGEKQKIDTSFIQSIVNNESKKGKRVLLFATEENGELSLTAVVSLSDPLRREAKQSVEALKDASIQVVMITGDSQNTAEKIARDAGIVDNQHNVIIDHLQFSKMSDDEVKKTIPKLAVLSRALPEDKSRLVKNAEELGLVVGMTGDGINDAPALKLSDVGFAMGSGTRVAKEAGDIIILDNNLSSIVNAVLFGRNIFKSIRKFLVFQLTMNFSSCILCMIAPFFSIDTPITVSQMLWVNMIMDTLGGLAFAGEAPQKRIMKEKPKSRKEKILNKYMFNQILVSGFFSLLISLLFLKSDFFISRFRESKNDIVHMAGFFALFIFLGVFLAICSRSDRLNLFNGLSKNKTFIFIMFLISSLQLIFIYFGGEVLRTTPLTLNELIFTVICSFSIVPLDVIRRFFYRLGGNSEGF